MIKSKSVFEKLKIPGKSRDASLDSKHDKSATDIDTTNISVIANKDGKGKEEVDQESKKEKSTREQTQLETEEAKLAQKLDDKDSHAIDASSIGRGAPTVDTSIAAGRIGDDLSTVDALLHDANAIHPTIRRTEVVLKQKEEKKEKDNQRKIEDFARNTQTGTRPGSVGERQGDGEE